MPMGADGSPGLAGDSLEDPEDTRMAEMIVTAIWKENEAARTQRLRSPKVRWKAEIKPAPSRKERIEVRDLVQARDGVAMGRSLAPRARKIVFPVCIETKQLYALYAQLSTRPETMKQTIKTRSAHLVEMSAERWDLTFCKIVAGPGGDELLPLTLWLPSRGPSRYEYLW